MGCSPAPLQTPAEQFPASTGTSFQRYQGKAQRFNPHHFPTKNKCLPVPVKISLFKAHADSLASRSCSCAVLRQGADLRRRLRRLQQRRAQRTRACSRQQPPASEPNPISLLCHLICLMPTIMSPRYSVLFFGILTLPATCGAPAARERCPFQRLHAAQTWLLAGGCGRGPHAGLHQQARPDKAAGQ